MNPPVNLITCAFEGTSKIANPPTTSLASVNGPSVTVTLPPSSLTRAPAKVGNRPPACTITQPSLPTSCRSWSIASMSGLGGGRILLSFDFPHDMKRMDSLLLELGSVQLHWKLRVALGRISPTRRPSP